VTRLRAARAGRLRGGRGQAWIGRADAAEERKGKERRVGRISRAESAGERRDREREREEEAEKEEREEGKEDARREVGLIRRHQRRCA
jgi:hypothetical protein